MSQNWKMHFKISNSTTCGDNAIIFLFKSNSQYGDYSFIFRLFVTGLEKGIQVPLQALHFLALSLAFVYITVSSRVVCLDSKCCLFAFFLLGSEIFFLAQYYSFIKANFEILSSLPADYQKR